MNVGFWPNGVAVDPTGTKIYVANDGSSTVSIIDTTTNNVTVIVNGLNYPYGVAVNPTGTKVYVANSGNNSVSVIDTATNTVTATAPVGDNPMAFGQFISKINWFYDIENQVQIIILLQEHLAYHCYMPLVQQISLPHKE